MLALLGAGCAVDEGGEEAASPERLVVYSGRNKSLIGPLLERFEAAGGVATDVRYGGTAELAATILEEGEGSPCDLFIAQDAAALGMLSRAGLFTALPEELLRRLPERFRSPRGDWVGLSGRARSVVYNTEQVSPEELPQSLEEVADPRYRGRFGVAPANASLQAHLASYRAIHGHEALLELLGGIVANEPQRYPRNSAIVEAALSGEIDWGLVNHYYLWRALAEQPEAPGANYFMPEGGASQFLNLSGAAVLRESPAAHQLLGFLLSEEAQGYFAEETFEYPLVAGVAPSVALRPLDELLAEQVDFAAVADALEPTVNAIATSGLLE